MHARRRQPGRHALLAGLAALAAAGCAAPGPIFPPVEPPIAWPPAPDVARIRYVGQLTGETSLNKPSSSLEVLNELLTGPKPKAAFITPMAVAVEGERVYVADPGAGACAIHVLDLETREYRAIRQAGGAPLQWPIDVAGCGDRIAVADVQRGAVFFYSRDGAYLGELREGLNRPVALAWSETARSLFVLDSAAHGVVVTDREGRVSRRFGGRGGERGQFNSPTGLALLSREGFEHLVVADAMNFRVQIVDLDGSSMLRFGKKGDAAGDFSLPRDVAADSAGHIYVLDNQFENIQVFDSAGTLLTALGREGSGPGEFSLPSGITIDARNRIWVADTYNRRVQVFQYLGEEPTGVEEPTP